MDRYERLINYLTDPEYKTESKYESNRPGYLKCREAWLDLHGSRCSMCGFDKYKIALEFHHINPKTRDGHLGSLIRSTLPTSKSKSSKRAHEELKKCVLLCANCHKHVHSLLRARCGT